MKTLGTLAGSPGFPSKNSVQVLLLCTYHNYHRINRYIIQIVRSLSCNCEHLHVVSSKLFSLKIVLKLRCVILQCERVGYLGNQVEDCTEACCCVSSVYSWRMKVSWGHSHITTVMFGKLYKLSLGNRILKLLSDELIIRFGFGSPNIHSGFNLVLSCIIV